jgi:hypothetical protein
VIGAAIGVQGNDAHAAVPALAREDFGLLPPVIRTAVTLQ